MFERFTEGARRAVVLAQEEARSLQHRHIGTEDLLLGLLHDHDGVAAQVLHSLGLDLPEARSEVVRIIGLGEGTPASHVPFTPRAKKVLELSLREAIGLGHQHIGAEHILLGLLREEGVGAQVLSGRGITLEGVRQAVQDHRTGEGSTPESPPEPPRQRCPHCRAELALATKALEAEAPDGPVPLIVVYCRACGTTVGVLPPP